MQKILLLSLTNRFFGWGQICSPPLGKKGYKNSPIYILKKLFAELWKLDKLKLNSLFSFPYFLVKFKMRLRACLFELNFKSDLAIKRLQPLIPLWLRHWSQCTSNCFYIITLVYLKGVRVKPPRCSQFFFKLTLLAKHVPH